MVTSLVSPRFHWSPESPFADSLNSVSTALYLLRADPLRRRCTQLTLLSTSIGEVISRCSNTLLVRLRITDHCRSLMTKHIYVRELNLDKVLLTCRKAFIVNDKDFCIFSFLSIIIVLYFIEANSCINTKGFIPRRMLYQRLVYWGLRWIYLTNRPCHFWIF